MGDLPYGYDHKFIYSHVGYNLKATDMQAAVGVEQLKKAAEFIAARRRNHEYLYGRLKEYGDAFILPKAHPKAEPSPFGFALTVREGAGFTKSEIVAFIEGKNIATRQLFAGNMVRQPAYRGRNFRAVGDLAGADMIMNGTFWVGVYPGIDQAMLDYVADAFHEFMRTRGGVKK
jgi:CDP-6-deoxy-D-xylo-4-hexulose-3-dehydrase